MVLGEMGPLAKQPPEGLIMLVVRLRSIWSYRYLVISAVRGEMKGRFAASKIGGAWFILHPLALALIYSLVLSKVLGAKLAGVEGDLGYSVFLIAGIAVWTLFSDTLSRSMTIFIEYADKLKKISFPRSVLPLIVVGNSLTTQFYFLGAILAVFVAFGHVPSLTWLTLPLAMIVTILLAVGIGLLLGIFNIFSRDVGQVMTVVLNLWFWLTPIVYPSNILSENLQTVTSLNPATPLVLFYQEVILYNRWPDLTMLVYPSVLGIILCLFTLIIFRRASAEIVDVL